MPAAISKSKYIFAACKPDIALRKLVRAET